MVGILKNIYSSIKFDASDLRYIIDNSGDVSILQSIEYVEVWEKLGAKIVSIITYVEGVPSSFIIGRYLNILNIGRTLAIGGLGGGCPIVIDTFQDHDKLKIQEYTLSQLNNLLPKLYVGTVYLYPPISSSEPLWSFIKCNGYEFIPDFTPILDISIGIDSLWLNLDKKNRTAIRYAQKNNVEIVKDNSNKQFNCFYEILVQTAQRSQFKVPNYKTLKTEFDVYSKNRLCDIWIAKNNGEPVSGAFIWKYKRTINYVYGASLTSGWNLKSNNLLHWKIIENYQSEGYTSYNMWGAVTDKNSPSYGGAAFKMSFGPKLIEIPKFKKINKKWLSIF